MTRFTTVALPLALLVTAGLLVGRADADRDRHGEGHHGRGHDDDGDDDDDDDDDDGGGERGGGRASDAAARATAEWATYQKECGSCHLAYPPRFLPATSWTALLAGLDDHFGENAELAPAVRKKLDSWIVPFAAPPVSGTTPLRITTSPWWVRKHDEVAAAVWKRKAVGSKSNCAACHRSAEQGRFSEHDVQIPRDADPPR